ncbi:hypothetical protein Q8F55_001443 [Vanrija albida]|uniref:3-carboxymuconate cyclase n=1 Tax=Vanrija albida TaxID=181172 RepID=A0ABR3QG31_9TREE
MLTALLFLLPALAAAAPARKQAIGANYFQTNGFAGNQLVANYIAADGTLVAGSAVWTGGNGSASINAPGPMVNHPDPLVSSNSVIVVNSQVLTVNGGSNTFSVFDIDAADPAKPALSAVYPTFGEFPNSLGASKDGKTVCVLNAGKVNGFACYAAGASGWEHLPGWDRTFGLNLPTPPINFFGTPSSITFAADGSALHVAVKGRPPTDPSNPTGQLEPGAVFSYAISGTGADATLAAQPTKTPAGIPFALVEDVSSPGAFVAPDPATGYAAFRFGANASAVTGTLAGQMATCWAAQSPLTRSVYLVDAGTNNVTEVAVDPATLMGTVRAHHHLGTNATITDVAIGHRGTYDLMYVLAPGYRAIRAFKISGPGKFKLIQRFEHGDLPKETVLSMGFNGQAVFWK